MITPTMYMISGSHPSIVKGSVVRKRLPFISTFRRFLPEHRALYHSWALYVPKVPRVETFAISPRKGTLEYTKN